MRAQSSCRSNLLQCILMISDEDLHEPESRVQQDLNELLDVLQTLEEFEFPFLKVGFKDTLQQVLAESNFKPSITPEIMSYLDLSLPWIAGYPAQAHNCEYMVFRHPTVKTWESLDEQQIYLVATSDPLVHLFFLPASTVMRELFRESTAGRHDLFTKIENLVRGIQESSEQCQELWVPKFRKETNEKLNWMMGYAVGKHYIQAGAEQSDVALSMPKCGSAGLVSDSKNALVLTKSFIFGALHTRLSDALEIPKFAMVIDESDFNK